MTHHHATPEPPAPPASMISVQGTLALDLHPAFDPPPLGSVPGAPGCDVVPIDRRRRRDVDAWVGRYLQAAVEIVAGDRSPGQLSRHSDPEVYEDLTRRAELIARAGRRPVGAGRTAYAVKPVLASVRTSHLSSTSVEACARLRYGSRSRAVAARFDVVRGRWVCTALEFC